MLLDSTPVEEVNANMRELHIALTLPLDASAGDEDLERAERAGREAAVLNLWESGHLSTRQSAKLLGLTYYDFIDLLAAHGLDAVRQMPRDEVVEQATTRLRQEPA